MESVLIIRITYLDTDRILIPGVNGVYMKCRSILPKSKKHTVENDIKKRRKNNSKQTAGRSVYLI